MWEEEDLYHLFEETLREDEEDCIPNEEIPTLYGDWQCYQIMIILY